MRPFYLHCADTELDFKSLFGLIRTLPGESARMYYLRKELEQQSNFARLTKLQII
jgi:hypothetical protein